MASTDKFDLKKIQDEIKAVNVEIALLPFTKKPYWEQRAHKELDILFQNPLFKNLIYKNFISEAKRKDEDLFENALFASLTFEYGLSMNAIEMLNRFRMTGNPYFPRYIGPIKFVSTKRQLVLPSPSPHREYKHLFDKKLDKATLDHLLIFREDYYSRDLRDFDKFYMPIFKKLYTKPSYRKRKNIKEISNKLYFREVLSLSMDGKSILEISKATGLDIKTISKYLNKAKLNSNLYKFDSRPDREEFALELGKQRLIVNRDDFVLKKSHRDEHKK
jgi:hypothetical protein